MKKTAEDHWNYIKNLTEATLPAADASIIAFTRKEIIDLIGFHYKSAFLHGWKHAIETLTSEATAKTVYTVDPARVKLRSESYRSEAEAAFSAPSAAVPVVSGSARRVLDADNSAEAGTKTKASKLITKNRASAAALRKEKK